MHPSIHFEKLESFYLHYLTWFKKNPGAHEALAREYKQNNYSLLNVYYVPGTVQSVSHTYYLILTTNTLSREKDTEETEAPGHMTGRRQTPKSLLLTSLLCCPSGAHRPAGKGGIQEPVQGKL